MGVVLSHTPNREPEYRKLLQAKSTKTAALFRKSSVRETPTPRVPLDEIKQNRSHSTASEDVNQTNKRKNSISTTPEHKLSASKKPPQITVTNPTKADLKESIKNPVMNHKSAKPPTPAPAKVEVGSKTPVAAANNSVQDSGSNKSEMKSSISGIANQVPSKPETKEVDKKNEANTCSRNANQTVATVEIKPVSQSKSTSPTPIKQLKESAQMDAAKNAPVSQIKSPPLTGKQNEVPSSPPSKSDIQLKSQMDNKTRPSVTAPSYKQSTSVDVKSLKEPVQMSSTKNIPPTSQTKDVKSQSAGKKDETLQNQSLSNPPPHLPKSDPQIQLQSDKIARPSTAPTQSLSSQNAMDNSSTSKTSARTDSGKSIVQPVLLKMVTLSKARGSVADRIKLFQQLSGNPNEKRQE